MNYPDFNALCEALPATTYVNQWGGAHVWKVGAKVFAIGGWADDRPAFTFKTDRAQFEMLSQLPGVRPAPYLASRGMTWLQDYKPPGLEDAHLRALIKESHRIVSLGLTKKLQRELGLNQPVRNLS